MHEKIHADAEAKSWIRPQPVHLEKELLKIKYLSTFSIDVSKTDLGGLARW